MNHDPNVSHAGGVIRAGSGGAGGGVPAVMEAGCTLDRLSQA